MNRSHKYKVWDKKEKKFLTDPKVEFVHHEKSWGTAFYLEIAEDWTSEGYDPTRYFFVECTELKDKNGRNIYDCDVVKVFEGTKRERIDRVIWNSYHAGFALKQAPSGQLFGGNYIEVIGNILENPEFLK